MSQAQGNGVGGTVCEVPVYRSPYVVGAGKRRGVESTVCEVMV